MTAPSPCPPEPASSLRTAYDAAWDAANAAWDEVPGGDTAPTSAEAALIEELEDLLGRGDDSPHTLPALRHPSVAYREPEPDASVDGDADALTLRHVPDAGKSSLAMVLDAAPRNKTRHVYRVANRPPPAVPVQTKAAVQRKRRPRVATIALGVVFLGGATAVALGLNGGPPAEGTATEALGNIPWTRAQTGTSNPFVARAPEPAATESAAAAATPTAAGIGGAVDITKVDDRVPQTDAIPQAPATAVRTVTTQAINVTPPAAAEPPADPAPAATPPADAGAVEIGVVHATTWVNMRAGPGADEAVIGVVDPALPVVVLSCTRWCEVVVNDQRGFIDRDYLVGL